MTATRDLLFHPFGVQILGMFVIVTEEAEQFPVTAVRRVVVVIVVLVVNGELPKPFARELPSASGADPWKNCEGFLAIGLFSRISVSGRLGKDRILFPGTFGRLSRCHECSFWLLRLTTILEGYRVMNPGLSARR